MSLRFPAGVLLATALCVLMPQVALAAPPTIREYEKVFTTYPFSDPNPIPVVGRIYPYFRFDGFTDTPVQQKWTVVELENDHLKVTILPQVGGKIWSAIDKRSGRSFVYDNTVVKFRDIAMRGPWTSGGIEANYGIIGHTPNVATPVDYLTRTNDDGSVSCIIGALDLLTRTPWRLEIRLGANDAAFSTTSSWYNASPLEQPYYSWMNAGIPVKGKLQFIYPGTDFLGHGGEHGKWPIDSAGRDLSFYDNNNFGGYKSYHVFGKASDFFGAWYHDQDFGMVRWSPRDEKAGKKIWIWGLSRQGMIWEKLLTDTSGQYAEVQSGRLFNQAAEQSTFTPFRHRGFAPHTTDRWTEWWYPVAGTKGMVAASRVGALNLAGTGDTVIVTFAAAVPIRDTLRVYWTSDVPLYERAFALPATGVLVDTIRLDGRERDGVRVSIGRGMLDHAVSPSGDGLQRPLDAPRTLDWRSVVGLHTQGKEWMRQREYALATAYVDSALQRDSNYVPALADRAMLAIRAGEYPVAMRLSRRALSIDTYDPAANYWYGLTNRYLGNWHDAQDGFDIAAMSAEYRGPAWTEMARMALKRGENERALSYSAKALGTDAGNHDALGIAIVAARRRGDVAFRDGLLRQLEAANPLSHQARFERLLATADASLGTKLKAGVRAELPEQVLYELAVWYEQAGEPVAVERILRAIGDHPEALYWRAMLLPSDREEEAKALVDRANALPPTRVFPFRPEMLNTLMYAHDASRHWKPQYYLALNLWSLGHVAAARDSMVALGDTPDYAPFYAARAALPGRAPADRQHDLERAGALDSKEWRYGKLLADHHIATGAPAAAVTVAARAAQRFPSNYILGLTLAKAEVAAGQYVAADAVLGKLSTLPYEGAADGRTLYRETKLMLAAQAIAAGRWSEAERQIAAAREWPERLGAGKPYAADVDERLEDQLQADVRARRRNDDAPALVQRTLHPGAHPVPGAAAATSDSLRYGVGTWIADSLGNHRAVLRVASPAEAVFARIDWRRRDSTPQKVNVVVIDATTQQRVRNVARLDINREFGEIAFQAPSAGEYYVYYLPYTGTFKSNYPKITYRVVENTADAAWLATNGLNPGAIRSGAIDAMPKAMLTGFDAVNEFSRFTPMEYIATAAELNAVRSANASAPFLAFAEDRALSIRMARDIPGAWAKRGAFQPFTGSARRGEFYSFQVGVWAHRGPLDSLRYRITALKRKGGSQVIPASAVTSFNLEGTDWSGRRFTRALHVDSSRVQALWFGVDLPESVTPGDYEGTLTLSTKQGAASPIRITIRVGSWMVANHGDDTPGDLTRLRWLNSQMAVDDSVVAPYVPMTVTGTTVSLLGRSLTFGADGMPTSIRSFFAPNNTSIGNTSREILAAPIQLIVRDSSDRAVTWSGAAPVITKRAAGAVAWETRKTAGALQLHSNAVLEFDGTAEYTVALKATRRTSLRTVTFELPLKADAAKYMMGLGQKGGYRPENFHWAWDVATKNQDAAWLGDVNAGLQFTLKDEHYVRPLNTNFYLSKPLIAPRSWANGGKGGCDIVRDGDRVLATCHSGAHVIEAGDSLRFDFRLMITPFKPLDTAGQWATRYFHAFVPVDSARKRGANTLNVHHANRVNPWINYPFIETAQMRAFVDSAHAAGMRAKIYYTVRELTNRAPEIFALRSLGDEVLSHGPGGGYSWLQEHLGDDYIAAWHVPEIKDAAVVNSGVSRWHNFYIEGLNWLVKNERIDGLYLDDVAFDRITMKRVRKVLDRGNAQALLDLHSANQYNPRDGFASSANLYLEHFPFDRITMKRVRKVLDRGNAQALLDLHSANQYNPRDGFASSANLYLEHFPFINRLWFGEYFDYDSRPDYWLVEVSGIPFGLMGEMLEKGGHPWRGMTMGMTARLPWAGDPTPLWKVWDDFGIQQSRMHGWWSGNDPVVTGDTAILATTWTKPGRAMISIGSWRTDDTPVRLTIDWKALGLDPTRTRLRAPEIPNFQSAGSFAPGAPITIPAKKGLLLIAEPQ